MMKNNLKIIICVGIPASGKSTWAKDFVSKNSNYIRVNRDDFRFMLKNQPFCESKIEELVSDLQNNAIQMALSKKLNIVIDNTNLKEKYFNVFIKKFNHIADIEFKIFDISLKDAIERDSKRENSVGIDVLTRMYEQYQTIKNSYSFREIPKIKIEDYALEKINNKVKYNPNLKDCVICDIDGTLSIMNRNPFDWKNVDKDYPNKIVINHINEHYFYGRQIILMSGRDCESRLLTEKWLKDNKVRYDELHMRGELTGGANQDYRKDSIIKEELYNEFVKNKYNVLVVYDDRQQVVDLWRKLGLECFQVNESPD